ncbi:uncharacterized protein LOC125383596 [Haliotis rufescens]|uniref:uncharacterized protein LOC125383596 n=1 Tax=Haliotis rufescens TaxID=6454 RepID=UPI00201E996E|nr:uncharacterized protein LOC125383596 [Haliotis rufescens]
MCERPDIIRLRINYLRTIKKKRDEGYEPVYLDKTWVNACHTGLTNGLTQIPESHSARSPPGKGERVIVFHAGSHRGFLPGSDLVFRSRSTDGGDYHTEMNSQVFTAKVEEQLLLALPDKSLVVMDNAPYHSCRDPINRCLTSNSNKGEICQWLDNKSIARPTKAKTTDYYQLVPQNKPPPSYLIDNMLREHGHEVLRLPPYHYDLNPIELIWGDFKNMVARQNKTFKLADVKQIVLIGMGEITDVRWANCVQHVIKVEEEYWKQDFIRPDTVQPVVVHLGDSTDSESDDEGISWDQE